MRHDAAHDWILDVLTDLKQFARANGMPALAEQLDDTRLLASAEIASLGTPAKSGPGAHDGTDRTDPGTAGTRQRA